VTDTGTLKRPERRFSLAYLQAKQWCADCTPRLWVGAAVAYLAGICIATSLLASTNPEVCKRAASEAALSTGVPVSVLLAISLTETGRNQNGKFEPWPWTVNMEGVGKWLDTRKEAVDFAESGFNRGALSFDIGCFQLNYKWHGKAFQSIEQMFDPKINALYAARYLLDLFRETGNWDDAAGAYHSRTPKYANRYKKRFARIHAALGGDSSPIAMARLAAPKTGLDTRKNRYPLLLPQNVKSSAGSLVPLGKNIPDKGLIVHTAKRLF